MHIESAADIPTLQEVAAGGEDPFDIIIDVDDAAEVLKSHKATYEDLKDSGALCVSDCLTVYGSASVLGLHKNTYQDFEGMGVLYINDVLDVFEAAAVLEPHRNN